MIDPKNSLFMKNYADLAKCLPFITAACVAFIPSARAQESSSGSQNLPQQSQEGSGEAKENQSGETGANNSSPENNQGLVAPLNGQSNQGQPGNGGIMPLITPLAPSTQTPIEGAPLVIEGDVAPDANGAADNVVGADPTGEAPTEAGVEDLPLPESEQEQIVSSLTDELFLSQSLSTLSSSLAPSLNLGSNAGSISEMAGLIAPGMPASYSKKGISFNADLSQVFDTNPLRAPESNNPESDWITTGAISVAYQPVVKGVWSLTGNYRGGYNSYAKNSDVNGIFQNGAAVLMYDGARMNSIFRGGLTMNTGASRDVQAIVDQQNYNISNTTRYALSQKTSIEEEIYYGINEFSGVFDQRMESYTGRITGIWQYSPLTEFGLGVKTSFQTIGANSNLSTTGPSILANYQLSRRIQLHMDATVNAGKFNDAISKTIVDANFSATYSPTQLWTASLNLRRGNYPLFVNAQSNLQTNNGINLSISRRLQKSYLTAAFGYELANVTQFNNSAAAVKLERTFSTFALSYTRPIYLDRVFGTLSCNYSDQSGNFDRVFQAEQLGLSITYAF
jgi:hypothetical protein